MSDTTTHTVTQYAIRLPDGQLYRSDSSNSGNIVQDDARVWFRRDWAEDTLADLRKRAVSTGTTAEFDAGATVVQRTVLVIGLPFEEVSR